MAACASNGQARRTLPKISHISGIVCGRRPAAQEAFGVRTALVGCIHGFGLFAQHRWSLPSSKGSCQQTSASPFAASNHRQERRQVLSSQWNSTRLFPNSFSRKKIAETAIMKSRMTSGAKSIVGLTLIFHPKATRQWHGYRQGP